MGGAPSKQQLDCLLRLQKRRGSDSPFPRPLGLPVNWKTGHFVNEGYYMQEKKIRGVPYLVVKAFLASVSSGLGAKPVGETRAK